MTIVPEDKEIFFHVGLAKTGTTFLQYRVFPKFSGICYIQRTRYRKAIRLIQKSPHRRIFLSNEFDLRFEEEMKKMGAVFPYIHPIIVFRRQDDYIASQYRRFVKNGFRGTFRDFFDLEDDKGYFKKKHLEYLRHIRILEENFRPRPIVLFYQDMRKDPGDFIRKLGKIMNVSVDPKHLDLSRKHRSFSDQQLKVIQWMGRFISLKKRETCPGPRFFCFFFRLPRNLIRYPTLWIGGLLPPQWFSDDPLIPPEELEKIREFYTEDWEACRAYAAAPLD